MNDIWLTIGTTLLLIGIIMFMIPSIHVWFSGGLFLLAVIIGEIKQYNSSKSISSKTK